jgi:hypothetical protein
MTAQSQQRVLFPGLFGKDIVVQFSEPEQSSDGGILLLAALDKKIGLIDRLADAIRDRRQSAKVIHELRQMLRERIFGIACGYPDTNDASRMGRDPIFRRACDRPKGLASQPTLSRLEHSVTRTDLLRMAYALTDTVLETQKLKRRPSSVWRITVDLDPTDDPTYGDQQLTFFNAYYDSWCYLPMVTTVAFNCENDQHVVAPVLRPGNAKGSLGALAILKRLIPRLRRRFRQARILVRMDGAFATPEVLQWLEAEEDLGYLINMPKNSVLAGLAAPFMKEAKGLARITKQTERIFAETGYQAHTWDHPRRVIIKAEVTAAEGRDFRDNPRFVVTNLQWPVEMVYKGYVARGDMENRVKELHQGLRFDLTSASTFLANQFRNLLTTAAYVLFQELRYHARGTDLAKAQVWTLRERLIKFGSVLRESVRRFLTLAPAAYPWFSTWRMIAVRLGASP